jgi:hypothetical protein
MSRDMSRESYSVVCPPAVNISKKRGEKRGYHNYFFHPPLFIYCKITNLSNKIPQLEQSSREEGASQNHESQRATANIGAVPVLPVP